MPGVLKWFTRWLSRPDTFRGELTNRFRWRVRGQWKVGEDEIGNEYYLFQPFEETPIRRMCIYKEGDLGTDTMPFLWYQWIRYQRNNPPTPEELMEYDEYLEDMKRKAEEFEARDRAQRKEESQFVERQRKQAEEERRNNQIEAQQEIMSLFAEREKALRIAAEQKMARMKEAEDAMKVQKVQEEKISKMRMEAEWRAGQTTPTGSGSTFRPGTWRPDQEEEEQTESQTQTQTPIQSQTQTQTNETTNQTPGPTTTDTKSTSMEDAMKKTKRQPFTPPKHRDE